MAFVKPTHSPEQVLIHAADVRVLEVGSRVLDRQLVGLLPGGVLLAGPPGALVCFRVVNRAPVQPRIAELQNPPFSIQNSSFLVQNTSFSGADFIISGATCIISDAENTPASLDPRR